MAKTNKQIWTGIIFAFLSFPFIITSGQENKITIRLDSILLSEFVDTVESIVPVRIYYSETWTDSLALSVNADNSSFNDLMSTTLGKDGFSFFITEDNRVILSKDYAVKTDFRKMYLDHLSRIHKESVIPEHLQTLATETESTISDEYRLFKIGRRHQIAG